MNKRWGKKRTKKKLKKKIQQIEGGQFYSHMHTNSIGRFELIPLFLHFFFIKLLCKYFSLFMFKSLGFAQDLCFMCDACCDITNLLQLLTHHNVHYLHCVAVCLYMCISTRF